MTTDLNQLFDQYDEGVLSRRHLFKGLALLAGTGSFAAQAEAAAAAPASSKAIAPVLSINHTHCNVSDMNRAVEFYQAVFGAVPREAGKGITTMTLPGATKKSGCWISLSLVDPNANAGPKPGTYNHAGYGVDLSDPVGIVTELKKRWPGIKTGVPNRTDQLFIYDPDGLPLQLMIIDHDGYIASEKVPDGKGGTKDVMKYKPGEHLTT